MLARGVCAVALLRALHRELAQVRVLVVALRAPGTRAGPPGRTRSRRRRARRSAACCRTRRAASRNTSRISAARLDVEVVAVELEALRHRSAARRSARTAARRGPRRLPCACSGCRSSRAAAPAACARCRAAADHPARRLRCRGPAARRRSARVRRCPGSAPRLRARPSRRPCRISCETSPPRQPRRRGDAVVMTLEQLPVAAGLVVVAVEIRGARDLDEVAVALVGLGEHREVEDLVLGTASGGRSATCW